MRHRDDTVLADSPSRSDFLIVMGGPHHVGQRDMAIQAAMSSEEYAYAKWCQDNQLDPQDTQSMVEYEGDVGWLYLDDETVR
ncbi:MAG TPA: hypothetical protein VMT27_07725 [Actinomycetes bacterium]|nr:hypothetical protein [Actinomycetes bacterium]